MNKTIVTIIVIMLLIGGGVYFFTKGGDDAKNSLMANDLNENKGMTKDAMDSLPDFSRPTSCTYKTQSEVGGTTESKIFIDGKKYRSEFSVDGDRFISLSDGEVMYNWQDGSKEGMKMNLSCVKDLEELSSDDQGSTNQEFGFQDYENPQDSLEGAVDVKCQTISNVDVSIPGDIVFTDQCALIKEQMEKMRELQENLPVMDGIEIPVIPGIPQ